MTERTLWLIVAAFVAAALWLLAGAVLTVAHRTQQLVPATAPGVSAVPAHIEEATDD